MLFRSKDPKGQEISTLAITDSEMKDTNETNIEALIDLPDNVGLVFECRLCLKHYPSLDRLKKHRRIEHPGDLPICAHCEETFDTRKEMATHSTTH